MASSSSSSGEIVLGISGAEKEKFFGDRFSSLPDALAHRILSFVNVDEFGRLMLVSKTLNQLCFTAPCLSMVNNTSSADDSSHRAKLDRFFNAYFSRRRQYGAKIFVKQLSKGINISSLEGVETLHIDDCYLTDIEVPAIAFLLKMMPDLKNIYVSSSKVYKRISFTPTAQFPTKSKNKVKARIEGSDFKVDYWEAQELKFVQKLEAATVEIHKEQGNAAELVKYFAKHCENLEVICPSAMVSAVSGQIEVVKSNAVNVTYVQGASFKERILVTRVEIEEFGHKRGSGEIQATHVSRSGDRPASKKCKMARAQARSRRPKAWRRPGDPRP